MPIRSVNEMVKEAKAEITTVDVKDAIAQAERGDALLVDIRDIRELKREGRVAGAYHAPRGMLEFWISPDSPYYKPALNDGRTLLLFCAGAMRSALAAKALQDMGVEKVGEIADGFRAFKEIGAFEKDD